MKTIFALFALLLVIAFGIYFYQNNPKSFQFFFANNKEVGINNHVFKVSIAQTSEEKQIGLSNKSSLPQDQGMLFPFEKEGFYSFWMRDMKFPIDIIYIRKNKIVTIYQNVQPPKIKEENIPLYKPEEPADKVLEINAGLSQKYGFKKGDEVKIK